MQPHLGQPSPSAALILPVLTTPLVWPLLKQSANQNLVLTLPPKLIKQKDFGEIVRRLEEFFKLTEREVYKTYFVNDEFIYIISGGKNKYSTCSPCS